MPPARDREIRFWSKVDKEAGGEIGCWLWRGSKASTHYGEFVWADLGSRKRERRQRVRVPAHHVPFLLNGEQLEGMQVHHDCGVPLCVNPKHLRVLTPAQHKRVHMKWTRETILEAMAEFVALVGRPPCATDWNPRQARTLGHQQRVERFYRHQWPYVTTVQDVFGSWSAAITAAGFQPRTSRTARPRFAVLALSDRDL